VWAARARLFAEHLRHVKKICDILNAQHATAAECGFENVIAASERSRV
jgi:hypothetical protein